MADQEQLKLRLRTLARRVLDREPTNLEEIRLALRVESLETRDRAAIKKSIASVLDKTESQVMTKLASHDDSDRIIDEITNALGGGNSGQKSAGN